MTARTDRKLALIVGAVLAGVFTLCAAASVADWTTGRVERTSHKVIPGPVQQLTLDARSGDVTLVPSETDEVVIDSQSSGTLKTPELEVRPNGTHVSVSGGCPEITFGHCSAEIVVRVPARTAVEIDAGSGDISAQGLSGNVDLHSSSGDVVGSDLSGFSVQLKSSSGDIDAIGLRSGVVVARTSSGDVTVQNSRVPESVQARSNSGDVAVFVPPGDVLYSVTAETNSGDPNIGVASSNRATNTIVARTNSGDVNVDYGS
jgi:DUF4097 and DUF4098 domain-containing protein YvlB